MFSSLSVFPWGEEFYPYHPVYVKSYLVYEWYTYMEKPSLKSFVCTCQTSPILYLHSTVFQHSVFYHITMLLFAHFSSHFTSLSRPPLPLITVGISLHNTDNIHIDKHSGTIPVILARHWLWLPDDGSCVNRNMLEQILYF